MINFKNGIDISCQYRFFYISYKVQKRSSLARFSARERFAKRYFPYRELRILAERFFYFIGKFPLSHVNVARYFL